MPKLVTRHWDMASARRRSISAQFYMGFLAHRLVFDSDAFLVSEPLVTVFEKPQVIVDYFSWKWLGQLLSAETCEVLGGGPNRLSFTRAFS